MESAFSAVRDFLHAEFASEQASNFARLRCVPSTYVVKFLDCYDRLNRNIQAKLSEALVQNTLCYFFPQDIAPHPYTTSSVYRDFIDYLTAVEASEPWKYKDLHMLRLLIAEFRRTGHPKVPSAVIERVDRLVPVQAKAIRSTIKQHFGERFGARPEGLGGGEWRYRGQAGPAEVDINIDYAGRHAQLRYGVQLYHPGHNIRLPIRAGQIIQRMSFEQLLGIPFAEWDLIHAESLEESIVFLCDSIVQVVDLVNRLPTIYQAAR